MNTNEMWLKNINLNFKSYVQKTYFSLPEPFLNRSYLCIKLPIDQYNMTPHNRREMRPWKTI